MSSWKYFEREDARALCEQWNMKYGEDIIRTPSSGALYWKGDIYYKSERAQQEIPFFVECKFQNSFSVDQIIRESPEIQAWMHKAKKQAPKGYTPILVLSKPRYARYVVIEKKALQMNKILKLIEKIQPVIITPQYFVFLLEHLKVVSQYLK